MDRLRNKKYIILTGLILVTMLLVLVMKYGTTDKYKGLVKVRNVTVNEKILSSVGTIESENTSKGIDEVEYKVKYTLDEIDGVTKRDVIIKGRTNSNYARFKGINKNNITSTLKENGKEIEVRIEDVPLGIEQELKLTLIIENAPNETRIKPSIEIREATGEYTSILTTGIEVETNSLEGLVLDENNIRVGNIELSLKKDGREVKRTYTDEDGKYTFTDIEEGRYNVEVEEEIYESVSNEIEIRESTYLNIKVRKIEPYRIETHKYIERLNLVVNGETKEYTYNDKEEVIETVKNAKTISGEIEYKIVVKNIGEKSGVITKIEDEPGEGLKFKEEGNTGWEEKNKKIYYRPIEGSTLDANKTKEIKLVLEIENTEEIKTYINKLTTNGEIYEKVVYVIDGEIYKEEEVLEGEFITPPSVPIENFDGWYTDINKTNKYKFSNPVRKDLILYGYTIEDIKYNVRYIDNEELYSSEEVKKNEYATKPSTDPSKEGYTFKYWSLDGENEYNFSTPVTEDIDLYSVYEINKYNVTFIDNNEEYNRQEISYNGSIVVPVDPSKEYYRFLYWSLEENGNPYDLNTPVTSNVTLYSVYEINRYRVIFIDQGNEISNELVDAGTLIQPIEVTKEGYTFKYWSEDNEHGYNFSTPVTKDVTLTSIYEINIYNVEFYHNDSLVKTLQVEYNSLINQAEVPEVTKEGYTFTFWSLQNESEGYDFTTRVTKNIKLYSNFVKQRKAVIFNDENRITEVTVDWGDTVNPITDKGKTGYTFSHWSLNVGGTAFDFSTPILEPTTLYAIYNINTYNITYNLDGGEVTGNPSTYTVETEDFTLNNPSKAGYNFIGWTGSNGNTPSTNVTVEKGTINDLTYTANYEVIEYTITYTLNGGTVTENPSIYTVETDTFTLNNPSKTGYTFTGWTGSNGETPEETVSIPKGSTGNRSYEAHYNINKYTVKYMNEGLEYSSEEVNYHDTATKPSTDPSKEGYEFKHWSLEENGSTYNFNTEIENNITLYSVYEINKYEVTFMDGESQYSKVSNIEHGSKVSEPSSHPDKNHNIFLYWTLNNEAYDFNTPVTSDITLYSKYEEVEKPTISHTPTEWTNGNVIVTITSDHNDYTYMYKINGGTYQSYTAPFEVSENSDITAYSVKTNISSVEEEHEIDNIDKINPLINYYEGEEITPTSIKIKIKIQDNESGIKLYKVYLDNTLLFTSNEYITNLNEEKTEEYTIGSLEQTTTYNVKVEIEDKVGNTSEETKQITTTAKHYVARITRINNVELGENYLDFETLKEAIEYEECEIDECKIEMLDNVIESNSILGGQEIELDLKGKTIEGTTGKTFINNGTFKVIDSSVEIEDGSEVTPGTGKILNTTNTAIENNETLIIGNLESPLLVSRTTPYIEGEIYGIDNNDTLNFYDGKIIGGTLAIRGVVTETPYSYNASVETIDEKSVATLEQIADAEARIGSTYYTLLQSAIDDARNGSIEDGVINRNEEADTVEMLKNITMTQPLNIVNTKNVTLDLAGYTLTTSKDDYVIKNNGALTITDSVYIAAPAIAQAKYEQELAQYEQDMAEYTAYMTSIEKIIDNNLTYNYDYTGSYDEFYVPRTGLYKIEAWGAKGGTNSGNGSYTSGEIELTQGDMLYIYSGGRGADGCLSGTGGGWNGGGSPGSSGCSYTGGGASDVRLVSGAWNNDTSLNSRIMVAAGGAGAESGTASAGGALNGTASYNGSYATQTSGSAFGYATSPSYDGSAGGGGYYGGTLPGRDSYTAGGGSSFISGYTGAVAITSESDRTPRKDSNDEECQNGTTDNLCSVHYSGLTFNNGVMKTGNENIVIPDGSESTGNPGNGYVRITIIDEDIIEEVNSFNEEDRREYYVTEEPIEPELDTSYTLNGNITSTTNSTILNNEGAVIDVETGIVNINKSGSYSAIYNKGELKLGADGFVNAKQSSNRGITNNTTGDIVIGTGTINASTDSTIGILNEGTDTEIKGYNLVTGSSSAISFYNNTNGIVTLDGINSSGSGNDIYQNTNNNMIIENSTLDGRNNSLNTNDSSVESDITFNNCNIKGRLYHPYNTNKNVYINNSTLNNQSGGNIAENYWDYYSYYFRGKYVIRDSTLISSSTNIVNNGNLEIYDSIITSGNSTSIDGHSSNSNIKLENVTFNTSITSSSSIVNEGIMNIDGGSINSTTTGATAINNSGTLTIVNEYSNNNKYARGIYNSGTLILGDNEDAVSKEYPLIQGSTDAVYSTYLFKYYDGKLIGPLNNALGGKVSDRPENYDIYVDKKETTEEIYLTTDVERGELNDYVAQIGTTKFASIQAAVDSINDNTSTTIELLKNVETISEVNVPENRTITIDYKNHVVKSHKSDVFVNNNGTLTLTDSSETVSGYNTPYDSKVALNNGTLTISKINFNILNIGSFIDNRGTFTFDGGTVKSEGSSFSGLLVTNSGDMYMNGGTLRIYDSSCYQDSYCTSSARLIDNTGTLTINGGSLYKNNQSDMITNTGSLNMTGGSINNACRYRSSEWRYCVSITINNSNILNITGGTFVQSSTGGNQIYNTGTASISDITIPYGGHGYENAVYNTGTMEITNSSIHYLKAMGSSTNILNSGTFGTIDQYDTANITIKDGNYNDILTVRSSSTLNIEGGTFNYSGNNINITGNITMNVTGGTFNSNGTAINNSGAGTITFGEEGGIPSKTSPRIVGSSSGFTNSNTSATVNFYDGIFGGSTPINGSITNIESGYEIIAETIDGKLYKYLDKLPIVEILDENGDRTALQCGTTEEEDCFEIQDAIDKAGTGYTIKLLRELTTLTDYAILDVSSEKNIIFDLNGYTLTVNNSKFILNNGDLLLKDGTNTSGKIVMTSGLAFDNKGTLTIESGTIKSEGANVSSNLISNSGTLNISGGTYRSWKNNCYEQYCPEGSNLIQSLGSTAVLNITGGRFEKITSGDMITNSGTMTMTGGTMNSSCKKHRDWMYCSSNIISNSGDLTISGVTFSTLANNHVTQIYSSGNLTVSDITFTSSSYSIVTGGSGTANISDVTQNSWYGMEFAGNSTATINSGSFGSEFISIANSASLTIETANVALTGSTGIQMNSTGSLLIKDGTFSAPNDLIRFISSGNTTILNGTFTAGGSVINKTSSGQLVVKSGSFQGGNGLSNSGNGSITIGEEGGIPSTTDPLFKGSSYGLNNTNSGATINFYDGKFGGSTAISGSITNIENGYEIIEEVIDGVQYKYLNRTPIAEIYDSNGDRTALQCGTTEEEPCYELQDAIDSATNGDTIKVIREVTTLSDYAALVVPSGKTITLDLNDYNLFINNSKFLENNGTLTLEAGTNSNGKIVMTSGLAFDNKGTFTIDSGLIKSEGSSFSGLLITNSGDMYMNGGIIRIYDNSCYQDSYCTSSARLINNTGTLTINGGTLYKNNQSDMITNTGSLNITGGSINNACHYRSSEWGYCVSSTVYNTGSLDISGGSFAAASSGGAYIYNSGTADIRDVTITHSGTWGSRTFQNVGTGTLELTNVTGSGNRNFLETSGTSNTIINSGSYDAGSHFMNPSGNSYVEIKGGTFSLSSSSYYGTANYINENATLKISGGSFTDTGPTSLLQISTGSLIIEGGTFNLSGGGKFIHSASNSTINVSNVNVSAQTDNILLESGTLTIDNASITSTGANGINMSGGSLTIGTKGGVPDQTTPSITGSNYGVYSSNNNARINFYDGILTGGTGALYGTVYEVEPGYREDRRDNGDGTHSDVLIVVGETERVAVVNGVNFMSLQAAVNYAVASNTPNITLYKSVTLDSDLVKPTGIDVYVITGSNTVTTGDYTVDSGIHIVVDPPQVGGSLNKFLSNIFGISNDTKDIIIYEMSDGSTLSSSNTYKLYKLEDNNYNIVKVEEESIGEYSLGKEENLRTIKGKIYIKGLEVGQYKLVGNDNKELDFEIYEDGVSNNIREKTSNNAEKKTTVLATLILQLRTGVTKVPYIPIILMLIVLILALVAILKKNNKKCKVIE